MKPVKGLNPNCRSISGLECERPETTCWWIAAKTYVIQADQVRFCNRISGLIYFVVLIDERERKRIYPSTGMRTNFFFPLSRGRKKKVFRALECPWTKTDIPNRIALSVVHVVWRFHTRPAEAFDVWSRSRDYQITNTQTLTDPEYLAAYEYNKLTTGSDTLFILFRNFHQLQSWLSIGV